jgi:hypothetical protein
MPTLGDGYSSGWARWSTQQRKRAARKRLAWGRIKAAYAAASEG